MKASEIRELLEKYNVEKSRELYGKLIPDAGITDYIDGFADCLELLFPLLEAHIQNANEDYRGNREHCSVRSFQTLNQLENKLRE